MRIAIAGAGIGGLTAAVALRKAGHTITVFERAPEVKPVGAGLALAANAIRAFREIGIDQSVIARGHVLHAFRIKNQAGEIISTTDSYSLTDKYGINNFSIHRADLHATLLEAIPDVPVRLGVEVLMANTEGNVVSVHLSDGQVEQFDMLIASDGIHSHLRRFLNPQSKVRYAGYTCWRGVVENFDHGYDEGEASETWGRAGRMGIVPLSNNRVYWFACINARANDPHYNQYGIDALAGHFKNFHTPIPQLIQATPETSLLHNDILDIKPVRKFAYDRIVLLGDAAHATTPNLGQGACMAIEDAVVLSYCIKATEDPRQAIKLFENRRIRRTTEIVNRSWRVGKVAQLSNPLLVRMRDVVMRRTPARTLEKQLDFLYNVSFQ